MALVWSIASGGWNVNAATVWNTGAVPQAGDTVEIRNGTTVSVDGEINAISTCTIKSGGQLTADFQMATSAFANIVIDSGGKLYASRAASSYLRVAGTITANGTNSLDYGTASDPVSNPAVGAVIEFVCTSDIQSSRGVVTGITDAVTAYGATRTWQTTLGAVAAIGDNTITLTDNMALRPGTLAQVQQGLADMIIVGHTPIQTANGTRNDEIDAYLVAGYNPVTKVVTLGDAGAGQSYWPRGGVNPTWNTIHQTQREVGTPVYLITNNVGIVGSAYNLRPQYGINNSNAAYNIPLVNTMFAWCGTSIRYCAGASVISAVMIGCVVGITNMISAAVTLRFHGGVYPVTATFSSTIDGVFTGADSGIQDHFGCRVNALIMSCTTGHYGGGWNVQVGDVLSCTYGASGNSHALTAHNIRGCRTGGWRVNFAALLGEMTNNYRDIDGCTGVAYGATLGSAIEYASDILGGASAYFESLDHDAVAGAFRAWCGMSASLVVTSQAVTVPPGYTQADQLALASATLPTFRQWRLAIQPGEQIEVTAQLRKDAAMTYRPRIQVIDVAADPLVDGVGPALAETIMTDSVDTWETLTATWANSGATERRVYVRVLGMNATGKAYAVVEWEVMMGTVATNVSTLLTRLTETRAGYLDNLSAGVTATATNISDAQSAIEDAIAEIPTVTPPTVEEIRTEMDANSTQLAAIVEDTGTTLPAAIAGLNDLSAAEVNAEVDTALSDYDGPTKAEMDAAHALLATAAALGIVDALVDAIKAKTDLITTNTAISVNSALSAGALTVYAGETLTTTFTGLTIPSNWKYIDLALKNVAMDTDAQSIVWIRATNPAAGTDGLQRLNGAAGTAAQGSLTVNQSAGTVAAWLADDATTQLTATTCIYGLKVIESDGDSSRLCADGTCTINNMVVKALT